MKTVLACLALLAASPLLMAPSAADPLGVEVNADPTERAAWERYYDTTVTACTCVNGVSTFHQTTIRQYLAEGKTLGRKVKLFQVLVPTTLAMRLASNCH
ncbi:hypothetical protein [Paraburkholderia rhizosphaerae]|uniref:HdeA/HdeB family protein n=1 Tax=Paraburkholderia rhizosphaerae TaxID=480658 RepID=A0A4R8LYR4_9BURK|nr:hypothetical protein [Paraburkholderia rhizosphaerae]TDY51836.1 hypothetical protein BX592_106130 [Paraburkholderia rhizosphaerae]